MERLKSFLDANFGANNQDPIERAIQIISEAKGLSKTYMFSARVLFNKGLGNQIYNIKDIIASDPQTAQKKAEKEADRVLGEGKWKEIKVLPNR